MILSAGYNFKEDPLATALILQTLSSLTTKKLPESFKGLRNKLERNRSCFAIFLFRLARSVDIKSLPSHSLQHYRSVRNPSLMFGSLCRDGQL
jgi:hypothetical protein